MKNKILYIIIMDCISFTFSSLLIAAFSLIPHFIMEIDKWTLFSLFIVTSLISILITLIFSLSIDSWLLEHFMFLFIIFAVVYIMGGGIFHWFSWNIMNIIKVAIICLIVSLITETIIYFDDYLTAKKINKIIEGMNNENYRD